MFSRRDMCSVSSLRRLAAGVAAACLLFLSSALPGSAQLLPAGFFDRVPATGGRARIEADTLAYDGRRDVISAEGGVVMLYDGYTLTGDRLSYNQATGELWFEGNVVIRDAAGTIYRMDRVHVTGGMKEAFLESLTLTTPDGALIRARDVDYSRELVTILTDATYSPCGLCIDSKGRRIGWLVKASKMTYDGDAGLVYLDSPSLEILGIPVAWVPWMVLPDPSQPRRQGFRMPSWDYDDKYGARLDVPYFIPLGETSEIILTPSLMSRQGLLMGAEWEQRFDYGALNVKGWGTHQLDPAAYAGTVGDTGWRGAMQATGRFTPLPNWRAGWSYTAFSDAAFLKDYDLQSHDNVVNEVYATYLTRDSYLDVRLQQFNLLGNYTPVEQERHARAIPNIEGAHTQDLGEMGQVTFEAEVLGVQRGRDHVYAHVPDYIFAYEENKFHATLEAAWQNQYILPAGVVATPYLGLRADAAWYDGGSTLKPGEVSLLEATPIAAIDFRWPLIAIDGADSHLFEPIAQLVYRGSDTTLVGITNDDAQSFVFDDTNLFSFNRFSGSDRQETGLRANIGGRYLANFGDGSWLQLIGGQSYHLAGVNALGIADPTQTGASTGLGDAASYIVLGAQGAMFDGLKFGAKAQLDASSFAVKRASAAAQLNYGDRRLGLAYAFIPADPGAGNNAEQHELSASATSPLPFEYWYADAGISWDLVANTWLQLSGGVTYDDDYLVTSLYGAINGPTHSSPNATSIGIRFKLRGPAGEFSL